MDPLAQYENVEAVFEGELKAYRAREIGSHRPVLLHQLLRKPGSGHQVRLLVRIVRYNSSLGPGSPNPILSVKEYEDSVWVVTEDRPEMVNLWEWLDSAAGKHGGPAETQPASPAATNATLALASPVVAQKTGSDAKVMPPSPPAPPASPQPGEFTMLFQGKQLQDFPEKPAPPAAAPTSPAPAPAAAPAGEFTMVFGKNMAGIVSDAPPERIEATAAMQRPDLPATPAPPAAEVMPAPPPPAAPAGEFTMVFGKNMAGIVSDAPPERIEATATMQRPDLPATPAPPVAEVMPAPPPPAAPAGEFTMVFGKNMAGIVSDAPPERIEATATMQRPDLPATPAPPAAEVTPAPPPPAAPAGEFTQMFQAARWDMPAQDQAVSGPPKTETPAPGQPSEFTRVFRAIESPFATASSPGPVPVEQKEPGAFTRIFRIPVGSDLLTESQTPYAAEGEAPRETPPQPPAFAPVEERPQTGAPAGPGTAPIAPPPLAVPALALPKLAAPAIPPVPAIKLPGPAGAGQAPGMALPKASPLAVKVPPAPNPLSSMPKGVEVPKAPAAGAASSGPSWVPVVLVFGGIILIAILLIVLFLKK